MKKTIITILSTALITGIVFGGILVYTISQYEGLLSEIEEDISTTSFDYVVSSNRYDNLYEDYVELQNEMDDLESDVYDLMTGNDYTISIDHDGQRHTWTKEKENWLFSNKSYSVSTLS